jgi:hypothetical protein
MNRPFGAGNVSTPGNGSAGENIISRDISPPQEQVETQPKPFLEPESSPFAPAPSEAPYVEDFIPASFSEVSAVGSSQEWEFAPAQSAAAEAASDTVESVGEVTPFVAETAVFDSPQTLEPDASYEAVGEPLPYEPPTFEPPPPSSTFGEAASFEDRASIESVSEPVPVEVPESLQPVSELAVESESPAPAIVESASTEEAPAPVELADEPIPFPTLASFEPGIEPPALEHAPVEAFSEQLSSKFSDSVGEPIAMPSAMMAESTMAPAAEISETEEAVAQGPPIPYQVPSSLSDVPMAEITQPEPETPSEVLTGAFDAPVQFRHSVESPSFVPQVISTEPLAQQPTTPANMPELTQTPPAPTIRTTPMTGGAQPQAASGMHTAVQLTFSFEIASMQLSPSFKMGALQLKPTSKIVTMRLAPSQQPQPSMNLQVTFEISNVQLAGNAIGMIRLTPSQQQRPGVITSPAFNVAGLQLLSGADTVQITPSQQGQASVHVTGRFQIATVEFSPSFEIASIVLNSTSKNVSVQLPGAGPSAVEGAPVFEITNVQLANNGEISMMQLATQGAAPKSA